MATIRIAFEDKPLFTWDGTANEMQKAMAAFAKMAHEAGFTPGQFAQSAAVHIGNNDGEFLPTNQQPQMLALMYLFLSQSTAHAQHPGHYRDYVDTGWEFDANFHMRAEEKKF